MSEYNNKINEILDLLEENLQPYSNNYTATAMLCYLINGCLHGGIPKERFIEEVERAWSFYAEQEKKDE